MTSAVATLCFRVETDTQNQFSAAISTNGGVIFRQFRRIIFMKLEEMKNLHL